MKIIKKIILALALLVILIVTYGYTKSSTTISNTEITSELPSKVLNEFPEEESKQTINMFVTHGHCSTPFSGKVYDLKIAAPKRKDLGNPLESLAISFEIDPNSFRVCRGDELTERIQTPGLFIGVNNENMKFRSTNVYTMGLDWYQINGILSIKGVEQEVKLFATGIKQNSGAPTSELVIQGQMNLLDWGIDYDKIVTGRSDMIPTKWMYINMKVKMS